MAEEGSRPLKDARHEAFARECVKGGQYDAFLKAFPHSAKWKRGTVDTRASELACKIQGRIDWLKAQVTERSQKAAIATREELAEIMTQIARSHLGDHVDENGSIRLDRLHTSAVESIEIDVDGKKKIKLRDPIRAAERLAKLLGYDAQPDLPAPQPVVGVQDVAQMMAQLTVEELRRIASNRPRTITIEASRVKTPERGK